MSSLNESMNVDSSSDVNPVQSKNIATTSTNYSWPQPLFYFSNATSNSFFSDLTQSVDILSAPYKIPFSLTTNSSPDILSYKVLIFILF